MKEIVFIDDDMRRMQFFVEYLELDGFVVRTFENPSEAKQYLMHHQDKIGLIIMDMIMPSDEYPADLTNNFFDTGLYLLRDLRKSLSRTPIILFSIRADVQSKLTKFGLKVDRVLVKDSTDPEQLSDTAKSLLLA